MFNRDNAIGLLLLAVCAVVAGYMVYVITTGNRVSLQINPTVGVTLTVAFFGLLIYGFISSGGFRRFGGRSRDRQWPDPNTGSGQRSLWDRLRGRK